MDCEMVHDTLLKIFTLTIARADSGYKKMRRRATHIHHYINQPLWSTTNIKLRNTFSAYFRWQNFFFLVSLRSIERSQTLCKRLRLYNAQIILHRKQMYLREIIITKKKPLSLSHDVALLQQRLVWLYEFNTWSLHKIYHTTSGRSRCKTHSVCTMTIQERNRIREIEEKVQNPLKLDTVWAMDTNKNVLWKFSLMRNDDLLIVREWLGRQPNFDEAY